MLNFELICSYKDLLHGPLAIYFALISYLCAYISYNKEFYSVKFGYSEKSIQDFFGCLFLFFMGVCFYLGYLGYYYCREGVFNAD